MPDLSDRPDEPVDDVAGDDSRASRVGDAEVVRRGFDELPIPVVLLEGAEHRVVGVNAAYRAFVGRDALLGSTVREALPGIAGQQLFTLVERVHRLGEPVVAHEWRVQVDAGRGAARSFYLDLTVLPRRRADGTVHGVLVQLTDVTDRVQQRITERAAAAHTPQRYRGARADVAALQEALLPPGLPVLPGLRIAGSYLLAADAGAYPGPAEQDGNGEQRDRVDAGGDWLDAVPRAGGRVALVVGDVVGHGVTASAVMGQLRVLLADRLAEGADLTTALAAVDRFARRTPAAFAATVGLAELDPADGTQTYCTAGHPPPLVVPADGDVFYLPPTGARPLGTGPADAAFALGTGRLGLDDALLLYTDGILERPGCDPDRATVELARVAADTAAGRSCGTGETSPTERLCSRTLELLVRGTGHTDDITLLAAQRIRPATPLHRTVPAVPTSIALIRAALGDWLATLDTPDDTVAALQHAIGELVTNAVEHAYRIRPGDRDENPADEHLAAGTGEEVVTVDATLTAAGEVRIVVADHGRWRTSSSGPYRGRGLAMAAALVDDVRLRLTSTGAADSPYTGTRDAGTTVVVTHRLSRPARLLTTDEITVPPAAAPRPTDSSTLLLIVDHALAPGAAGPGTDGVGASGGTAAAGVTGTVRIRVDGPLDATTAGQLQRELRHRTRGGTRSLTVDLAGVTHLASAAVAVLHDAVGRTASAGAGAELVIHAPPGSPAHRVLALVEVPHRTTDPAHEHGAGHGGIDTIDEDTSPD